jgi:hypothetical protein
MTHYRTKLDNKKIQLLFKAIIVIKTIIIP